MRTVAFPSRARGGTAGSGVTSLMLVRDRPQRAERFAFQAAVVLPELGRVLDVRPADDVLAPHGASLQLGQGAK